MRKGRVSTIEIVGKHKQTFTYDNFNRVTNVNELIGTKTFSTAKSYDTFGRVVNETYPSGYYTVNHYDGYSNLTDITDVSNRSVWKAVDENAKGQLLHELKGTKTVNYDYYANGLPYKMGATAVVDMEYVFDNNYNLQSREDKTTTQKEVMGYDTQNRLTSWTVTRNGVQAPSNTLTYDDAGNDMGNIAAKSDLGNLGMNYGEGNNRPHALTSINGVPSGANTYFFAYPLNVTYTNFKKVATISQGDGMNSGSGYCEFTYGVDDQRRRSVLYPYGISNGNTALTRYYVGNYEEEFNAATGKTKKIHYLSGAILIKETGVRDKFYYSYADYQGSLIALMNTETGVIEKYAYDPWGARRNPTNWTLKDTRSSWIVNRGYTGHEHIDVFGIINMNGRVYDPLTAQFYSPDPYVQSPDNWLNYNRYGYCYGNPFKYTDPSGELFIIDSWLIGLIAGGWNEANKRASNDVKIWGGLFATDPNKSFLGRVGEVISRLTWQLPQTAVGFLAAHISNTIGGHVNKVDYAFGATVLQTSSSPENFGAVTLGSYIIGNNQMEADANNRWFQHEYGHYLQSQKMGFAYLSRIGIPSLLSAGVDDGNHNYQPFEQDANRRAFIYFNKNISGFYQNKSQYYKNLYANKSIGWNFSDNPLDVKHEGYSSRYNYYDYNSSSDLALINGLALHAKWYDYFDPTGLIIGTGNGIYYNNNRVK